MVCYCRSGTANYFGRCPQILFKHNLRQTEGEAADFVLALHAYLVAKMVKNADKPELFLIFQGTAYDSGTGMIYVAIRGYDAVDVISIAPML